MIWWVILNAFKKMMNKTQFQISLPHPLWFLKTSTPSFLHIWCTLQLHNLLYHFNSLLQPPFINHVGQHFFEEDVVTFMFGCLQHISSDILSDWQIKGLENFWFLLQSVQSQFSQKHFRPISKHPWRPNLFWWQNTVWFTSLEGSYSILPKLKI